jgi:hypothetical protein
MAGRQFVHRLVHHSFSDGGSFSEGGCGHLKAASQSKEHGQNISWLDKFDLISPVKPCPFDKLRALLR